MSVDIETVPELRLGARTTLVETLSTGGGRGNLLHSFDEMPDGRLLVPERTRIDEQRELVIVKNWIQELDAMFER